MRVLGFVIFLHFFLNAEFFDPTKHKNWKNLYSRRCGHRLDDRIVGGEPVEMGAYPWMVRIAYKHNHAHRYVYKCGGVLANARTVITAAHCLEAEGTYARVAFVRLGEYDSKTRQDCWRGVCINSVQDIEPSSVIFHEDYLLDQFKHDIGIIRLKDSVRFSIYVKPICFPYGELMDKNFTGENAVVAGWGIKDPTTSKTSSILLAVTLPIVDNRHCKKAYRKITSITETHLCVGGIEGKDSCGGDSGGPLMKLEDFEGMPKYYLLGVVSFGPKKCGMHNVPGVYTKVTEYMKWILDNLKHNKAKYHAVY